MALRNGLPTEKEKLDFLYQSGLWSDEKERELATLQSYLESLKRTLQKLPFQSQKTAVEQQIKETATKIDNILCEKRELIGTTAEFFANKRANELFLFRVLYADKSLKTPAIDHQTTDITLLNEMYDIYDAFATKFNELTLKRISVLPAVLNAFSICEKNPLVFYGKPVVRLSIFQVEVFSYCRVYSQIIAEHGDKLPTSYVDNPDELIDFANAQASIESIKNKNPDADNLMLFGGKKEDYERIGLQPDTPVQQTLVEKAKQQGGRLTMRELMEMDGKLK